MARLIGMDALTEEQLEVRRAIAERRGGFIPKPHEIWTFRPEFARHAQEIGWYLNGRSSVSPRLSELATLLVARQWRAEYVWDTHLPRACEAGLSEPVIAALAENGTPVFSAEDESLVYEFVDCLHARRCPDGQLFEKAVRLLGRDGVGDLVGLVGYFSMIAVTVKAFAI